MTYSDTPYFCEVCMRSIEGVALQSKNGKIVCRDHLDAKQELGENARRITGGKNAVQSRI